jgi:hypothetical protein
VTSPQILSDAGFSPAPASRLTPNARLGVDPGRGALVLGEGSDFSPGKDTSLVAVVVVTITDV